MRYLPVRCELHGWLLLDTEVVNEREKHVIECEGHMITADTRSTTPIEITRYLPKTRGLMDNEFDALTVQTKVCRG